MSCKELKFKQKIETRDFETKLIIEVKNHCCIYMKNSPEYSNRSRRDSAWEDIADVLGKRVDECQKKWNSLRDCFRAIFREESNTPSGSGRTSKPKWVHFESLKFLIPYIKVPGDDCDNYSQEPSTNTAEEFLEVEVIEESVPSVPPEEAVPITKKWKCSLHQ